MNETVTFSIIALLLVLSPGPNGILILKTVSSKGKQAGIENIVGLVSATFLHGAISILGLSAIILKSALLFTIIKYLGAIYLFYLGFKTIVSSFKEQQTLDTSKAQSPTRASSYFNFTEGFLTQILNPKVSMFYLAAFPQFLNFQTPDYYGAFLLVSIHAGIIFSWFFAVTMFIQKIKQLSEKGKVSRLIQRASGALLIYFGSILITGDLKR